MMHLLWELIVGGVIGVIAGAITSRDLPAGWIGNVVAGLVGSWIGGNLFGDFGPQVAGMAIIPSILGAIILVLVASLFMSSIRKK